MVAVEIDVVVVALGGAGGEFVPQRALMLEKLRRLRLIAIQIQQVALRAILFRSLRLVSR